MRVQLARGDVLGNTAKRRAVVRAIAAVASGGQTVSIVPLGGNTGLVVGGTDGTGTAGCC